MKARRYTLFFLVLAVAAIFSVAFAADAQQQPKTCPTVVSDALTALGTNCANLSRNTSCFGHPEITGAYFAQNVPANFYTQPGDRSDLTITEEIKTGPFDLASENWGLNVMNVSANLPNDLSPKGVVYVQFGDVEVDNGVEPADAVHLLDTGISVNTTVQTDLLTWPAPSIPGHASTTVMSIPASSTLSVDAIDPARDAVRAVFNNRAGWVSLAALDQTVDWSTLPTIGPDSFTPMQRFYFRTGVNSPTCDKAPSLLYIQGPNNAAVDLRVFDKPIRIESTVILRTLPPGDTVGNEVQLIVLSGLVVLNPDTPDQIIVPPGFESHIGLGDIFVRLGDQSDVDEKTTVGTWSQPSALTSDDLTLCGVTSKLPSNIPDHTTSCPIKIQASSVGGVIPQLVFPNQQALDEARQACLAGELTADICAYLGL